MKILADENIAYVYEIFKNTGNVLRVPSKKIINKELLDTECLIIRSVTKIHKKLIKDTSLKFIGTATSGTDHIDKDLLTRSGIAFSSTPGCNAIAVAEYVFTSLLFLAEYNNFQIKDLVIGIIGVGNIGSYLNKILKAWGVETLLCDPPRFDKGEKGNFYTLNQIIENANVITFHTPLYNEGKYKTLHMVDKKMLLSLKPNTILINSCRGAVINNKELVDVMKIRNDIKVIIDVWEKEPRLLHNLLNRTSIATAHIAGHTLEAKIRATIKLYAEWCKLINKSNKFHKDEVNIFLSQPKFNNIILHGNITQSVLKKLVSLVYDVYVDDNLLRHAIRLKSFSFNALRNNYRDRREWFSLKVVCDTYQSYKILKKIGFNAIFQENI
ncbi:4-phosphoerythronate dehydrogenase [Candidatus Pantoea edessiphila]|uniref:Erythronate-4-phosphate dehydrogenase n=1 Tax=Candidatus Pantoea edessiphila TaxID=2044610 RepID=A0A2P5T0Y0_9GAMM|nr:4-phosphoerythronate dehydrogenase [Candidatus Pantoea edessiphila]PPI88235.1 4-phosphoerythronate dehydrogenase [Candidatus Pantoea edessiphila]